jgi:DNA-binding response OmpR family regulator
VQNSTSLPPTLRFGVFELDPRAGELRKKGMKIRLQGQPVEILAMLLERPGETVTPGRVAEEVVARRHICGLRAGPEQRHEAAAGGLGRQR